MSNLKTIKVKKQLRYDFDHEHIYETKTGNTVSEMSFEEVLNKILKENEDIGKIEGGAL
ncbi:hypothetical protein SAMN02745134_00288 [Clostridium acidisoli DSM 12555]|uniref:Uncharacterized protein n=1 Tax=Clostridium acidisoli DSM 12555 TaxID=1121291 RepID=A0A1W1WZZ9_9CLOT|nr:hypothetical protein [Clostridium acidisoli]SMC17306.1 hypothetical protein SAMN02745134_00288 [Clostridium acidisoli DSM 12555]